MSLIKPGRIAMAAATLDETIKATLVAAGFPAIHISIEGFGEQYATVAEGATDAQLAPDRDIAMRFTK